MTLTIKNPQVGQLNPSQLLYTYGIGAIVDLPQLSVIVTGLEDWPTDPSIAREVTEARLLRAVRATRRPGQKAGLSPHYRRDRSFARSVR